MYVRYFLPLTPSELGDPTPPKRDALEANPDPELRGEALEEFYEAVLDEAAFQSLELVVEVNPRIPVRIVAAAACPIQSWGDVESFLVDAPEASALIGMLGAADTQDAMDRLVFQICEQPLEWFDGAEEYDALRQRLV